MMTCSLQLVSWKQYWGYWWQMGENRERKGWFSSFNLINDSVGRIQAGKHRDNKQPRRQCPGTASQQADTHTVLSTTSSWEHTERPSQKLYGWPAAWVNVSMKTYKNVRKSFESFVLTFDYSVLARNGSLRPWERWDVSGQIMENEQFHNVARCLYCCLTPRRFWVQILHGVLLAPGVCSPEASRFSGGPSQFKALSVWGLFFFLKNPTHMQVSVFQCCRSLYTCHNL